MVLATTFTSGVIPRKEMRSEGEDEESPYAEPRGDSRARNPAGPANRRGIWRLRRHATHWDHLLPLATALTEPAAPDGGGCLRGGHRRLGYRPRERLLAELVKGVAVEDVQAD